LPEDVKIGPMGPVIRAIKTQGPKNLRAGLQEYLPSKEMMRMGWPLQAGNQSTNWGQKFFR